MTIQQILTKIKNSLYGEDVRQAIADGLQLCYDDKAVGGYCPVDNLDNYYSGAAFCTSSIANCPFQSSFIVMCAGDSNNCFQVAINTLNVNDGFVRNKQNGSWSAWMRLGVTKKIRYWNHDGSELLYTESVSSGGDGTWDGVATKESTQQYDYTFVGWSTNRNATAADPNATKNVTTIRDVYAAFTSSLRSYNVYFFNGTTLLTTVTVPYGSNALYDGENPTKTSTAQYNYNFVGWNSHNGESSAEANILNDIRDNKTVYAAYAHTIRSYNVYFYNGSALLFTDTVEYGSDAAFDGNTPTKASTTQYAYSFSGWNTDSEATAADAGALQNIIGERTVYAIFTAIVRTYTVRFMNGETVLQTVENVPYGSDAAYTGNTPRHPTEPDDYTFVGFNPDGTNITGNTDCQAVYILNPKELRYWNYNGTELLHTELVEVGGDGQWNGASSRESTADHSYIFLGWNTSTNASVADPNATKNMTVDRDVYATFEETIRLYSVHFYNGSTLLYTDLVQYGANASYTGDPPTKASTAQYDYRFEGWNSQDEQSSAEANVLNNITADKTVYAAFSSTLVPYNVYFYNGSTLLETVSVLYGNNASYSGSTPTKASTAQYDYHFEGWNSQDEQSSAEANVLNNITADKTVYAVFSSTLVPYNVYFYNGSTLLETVSVLYGNNASYSGENPTKASTAQYDYHFEGWNSQDEQSSAEANVLNNIIADKTVYAAFSSTLVPYNVYFYNGSTLLETVSVLYGNNASYSGSTPTKASTPQYEYAFAGWNSQDEQTEAESGVLDNITGDKTVYAAFSVTLIAHQVYFYNGSTLLYTAITPDGTTAVYSGATPTKASSDTYDYTFVGWNSQDGQSVAESGVLDNITADKTVYAAFSQSVRLVVGTRTAGTSVWINEYPEYDDDGYGIGTPTPKEYIYLGKDGPTSTNCILLRRWLPNFTTKFDNSTDYDTTDYATSLNGLKTADSSWIMVFDRKTQNSLVNTQIYYIASVPPNDTLVRRSINAKCFSLGFYEYGFTRDDPSLTDGSSYISALKKFYSTTDDNIARKAYVEGTSTAVYYWTRSVGYSVMVLAISNDGSYGNTSRGSPYYVRPAISVNPNTPVTISNGKTYLAPT